MNVAYGLGEAMTLCWHWPTLFVTMTICLVLLVTILVAATLHQSPAAQISHTQSGDASVAILFVARSKCQTTHPLNTAHVLSTVDSMASTDSSHC